MVSHSNDAAWLLPTAIVGGALYWYWTQSGASSPVAQEVDNAVSTIGDDVSIATTGQTRGERNNNPGNIIRTNPQTAWQGLSPTQNDPTFCQFTTPSYGIRAIHKNLLSYYLNDGCTTVQSIITRWSKTDQAAYVSNVAAALGVSPAATIDVTDINTATALVGAIITQENGRDIYSSTGILAQGMALS